MLTLAEKSVFNKLISKDKLKNTAIIVLSIFNGGLYFLVATEGGENLNNILQLNKNNANRTIFVLGAGASLVYTMFIYKTLESLSLKIDTPLKFGFSLLAPFSASAFFTAGRAGAEAIGMNHSAATGMGVTLFLLRTLNCTDASVKFPKRLSETKKAWDEAYQSKNRAEMARLIVVWLTGIGYAISTTDAIYKAIETISDLLTITQGNEAISYTGSILGALGTVPLTVYWSHRGLRQLTFGGIINADGTNPDPTDLFTYFGLILVTPFILGILGGATASSGSVFGQLSTFASVIRVLSSVMYACFAGTPGIATLSRNIGKSIHHSTACQQVIKSSWCNYYSKSKNHDIELLSVIDTTRLISNEEPTIENHAKKNNSILI